MISFLNKFCKNLSITIAVGEEVFKAIAFWEVNEPSNQFPLIRAGCLACQLTSPKVTDGVAKLITKSDLDKLKSPSLRPQLLKAEHLLNDAWQIIQDSQGHDDDVIPAFGRMLIRTILHLCKKEKMGREPKGHRSLEDICKLFAEEARGSKPAGEIAASSKEDEEKPLDLLSGLTLGHQALLQNKQLQEDGKCLGRTHAFLLFDYFRTECAYCFKNPCYFVGI